MGVDAGDEASPEEQADESTDKEQFRELPVHTFKKGDPVVFRHARSSGVLPDFQASTTVY